MNQRNLAVLSFPGNAVRPSDCGRDEDLGNGWRGMGRDFKKVPGRIDVAILGAVPQEVFPLLPLLASPWVLQLGGETFHGGSWRELTLLIGTMGIGKVNAAMITSVLLTRFQIGGVWNVGCAGAFAQGPLKVGDVLISLEEHCGDEGVLCESGPLPNSTLGLPLVTARGHHFFDSFPLDPGETLREMLTSLPPGVYTCPKDPISAMARRLEDGPPFSKEPFLRRVDRGQPESAGDFRLHYGTSLTVGMVSGDPTTAGERFRRHRACAENMEGSAVAQVCLRFGVDMIECRGMSNVAGDRNKENWALEKSIAHCHAIVLNLLGLLQS